MGDYEAGNPITQLCISLCKPLCVTEIQNCRGKVTEVVSFFRCVTRCVKLDGLSIEILCFCLMN
ncbi:hypothetical protein PR048_005769 [Dryococelus australis]|uniref:Uncharacterized protein n=1 Tax=Dryococelus australis TaxID=614101 RepID=A0ABQ9IA71_9NEOP|nr:hypothetical protein PR048_005769 [Dryococelus australis]